MTIPPTYVPSAKFAFPRSYCGGLYVRHDPGTLVFDGEILQFIVAGVPDALVKVYFQPNFYGWTSNGWTLDHVVLYGTYEYPPNPATHELPFYALWVFPPGEMLGHIKVDAFYGSLNTVVPLPPAPGDYWLHPIPG